MSPRVPSHYVGLEDDTPTHWLAFLEEGAYGVMDESQPLPIFPDPDVHKAFVLLRRPADSQLADDRFVVECPACHDGVLSTHPVVEDALVVAFKHRLSNLSGASLDALLSS